MLPLLFVSAVAAPAKQDEMGIEEELLLLIGEAQTSITRVGRLARAISRITSDVPRAVQELGGLGSSGRHPSNIERDLDRWTHRQWWRSLIPDVYTFKVQHLNPLGEGTVDGLQHVLLPHEMFHTISENGPELFKHLFYDTAVASVVPKKHQKRTYMHLDV